MCEGGESETSASLFLKFDCQIVSFLISILKAFFMCVHFSVFFLIFSVFCVFVCVPVPLLQGVVGTERSLKTAVVSLFVEGVLEIEGDEKGMFSVCLCGKMAAGGMIGGGGGN
jgi:hypothetical protein